MNKLIVILGPTASGKSSLALQLATRLHTEIISADSMAVYKNFNIGTAKPSIDELNTVKHHLINILEPHQKYSVADFQEVATNLINQINQQNKIPIVVGGTGLYIQALLEGYIFNDNLSKSQQSHFKQTGQLVFNAKVFGLSINRQELYNRINLRTQQMFDNGLINEVQSLLNNGVSPNDQAMLGIGYKEVINYLNGNCSLDDTISKVSQNTRNFAKRQLTWFRRMHYINWLEPSKLNVDILLKNIYNDLS